MTNISTERVYYIDSYLDKLEVKILEEGQDENGNYVIFDKTIFHPQGGGQPADEGFFEINGGRYNIIKLIAPRNPHEEPYLIKHYYEGERKFSKGEKVFQIIDIKKRLLYSRLHSAGQLLSDAVNQLYPTLRGIRANHFPNGQVFIIFTGEIPTDVRENKEKIAKLTNELVKKNLLVKIKYDGRLRTITINNFSPHLCGGTHIKNTSEIGEIVIRSIKKDKDDKNNLKIGYDIN